MESGQGKNAQPLLTIAIPTWNRADQLSEALRNLLPQVEKYPDLIEFIISDNGSTDNTIEIVNNSLSDYPSINFTLNKQNKDTGIFSNYHKCISLGTGRYLWLLSDDDYVFDGVIDLLIEILKKKEVGAVFLNDWTGDKTKKDKHVYEYADLNSFFKDNPHRHSLISSIIYAHTVHGDDEIFESLEDNALIGYAVYLKAIHNYNKFAIIKGNSLLARNDKEVRYDALWIFTVELAECMKLAKNYYTENIIRRITNSFLKTNIKSFYRKFKFYGKYNFPPNKSLAIFRFYVLYFSFWAEIVPFILCPKFLYRIYAGSVKKTKHKGVK